MCDTQQKHTHVCVPLWICNVTQWLTCSAWWFLHVQMALLQATLESEQKLRSRLEQQLSTVHADVEMTLLEHDRLQGQLSEAQQQLAETRSALIEAQQQVQETEARVVDLSQQVDDMQVSAVLAARF